MGARSREVSAIVVREGLVLGGTGLAVGAVLTLFLGSAMSELLWGVGSRDPLTLTGVALMALAVGTRWPVI